MGQGMFQFTSGLAQREKIVLTAGAFIMKLPFKANK
jgi:hypothetical protein